MTQTVKERMHHARTMTKEAVGGHGLPWSIGTKREEPYRPKIVGVARRAPRVRCCFPTKVITLQSVTNPINLCMHAWPDIFSGWLVKPHIL
jgi:hypothetical protein